MQSCLIRCLMGILLAASTATMAPAQNAQQATPQTLQAVIAASDGGTIALVPGDYGSLSLHNLQAPASAPRVNCRSSSSRFRPYEAYTGW